MRMLCLFVLRRADFSFLFSLCPFSFSLLSSPSCQYVIQYSSYAIGHLNSNIGRIMEEMMYATRQLSPEVESVHSVYEDAVDDFHGTNSTGY